MRHKTLIFIATYIAVVSLFGFSISTITTTTTAYGFTVNSADVVAATTTSAWNTITNNVTGVITHVVDGDTLDLDINGTISRIRFVLVNTPEIGEQGYLEAKNFVAEICPVGSTALLDVDNRQKPSFGRIVGVVYCNINGSRNSNNNNVININSELLAKNYAKVVTRFCDVSKFSERNWVVEQCSNSINNDLAN
jgi:micrococcal nuclease